MAGLSARVPGAARSHRGRLATRRSLLALAGLWLVLLVLAVLLAFEPSGATLAIAPLWLVFGLVGLVVGWHQPRNPVGWLLFGVAFFFTLESDASGVSVLDYRLHRGLPLGWLAVLLQPTWALAIVCAGLSLLLFPDGRFPSRHWRWPLLLVLALGVVWQFGALLIAVIAIVRNDIRVDSGGNLLQTSNPHGGWAWWGVVQDVFFASLGVSWISWLVWQVPRYRRATGEHRLQLKWLLSGAGMFIISGALATSISGNYSGVWGVLAHAVVFGLLGFPICIGIGMLRYRLYEIDRLISRTLSYAVLTGLLVGLFTGLVLVTTRVLPFSSPVGVATSTLAAAALFNPLRGRIQQLVDRRFNRARYDAQSTVAAFTTSLRDAVDTDTIRDELMHTVDRVIAPAHVSLWTVSDN